MKEQINKIKKTKQNKNISQSKTVCVPEVPQTRSPRIWHKAAYGVNTNLYTRILFTNNTKTDVICRLYFIRNYSYDYMKMCICTGKSLTSSELHPSVQLLPKQLACARLQLTPRLLVRGGAPLDESICLLCDKYSYVHTSTYGRITKQAD